MLIGLLSLYLGKKYSNPATDVPILSFTSPNNFKPAEIAQIYHGEVSDRAMTSTILSLANQGFLTIDYDDDDHLIFTEIKTHKRPTEEFEQIILDGLFEYSNRVSPNCLRKYFYTTVDQATSAISNKFSLPKYQIEEPSANLFKLLYSLLSFIVILLFKLQVELVSSPLFSFRLLKEAAMFASILGMFPCILSFISLVYPKNGIKFLIIINGIICLFPFTLDIFQFLMADYQDFLWLVAISFIFSLVCLSSVLFKKFRRTEQGQQWYNQTLGFKEFLTTAEKKKLEMLIDENPNYFYDILPYTYVLGVSKAYLKRFSGIKVDRPEWYSEENTRNFDASLFASQLVDDFSRQQKTFIDRPVSSSSSSSDSDSSSSGGGYSGGGAGGGGGGSW